MVRLGAEVVRDVTLASRREWLLTDGRGGYASSTVIGLNTRRQHGLLVWAVRPPARRMVLLSSLEEALVFDDRRHELATHAYGEVLHPRGFELAESFVLDPLPTITWEVEGRRFSRSVARLRDEPGVLVAYEYEGPGPATLEVRPLLAYRDVGTLQRENESVRRDVARTGGDVVLHPYEACPPLVLRMAGALWETDGLWYRGFSYDRDEEAGSTEDLFSHGAFRMLLRPGGVGVLVAWAGPAIPPAFDPVPRFAGERRRLRALGDAAEGLLPDLRRAADAFVVRRADGTPAVISTYPSGQVVGRDALMALPGLLLATGRHDEARALLADFAGRLEGALMANVWPEDGGKERFDGADVSLWWALGVARFLEATGDREFVKAKLQGALIAVLEGCRLGAKDGLAMSPDGLVAPVRRGADAPRTWLEAVGSGVPRRAFAVEVQSLWYNALLIGADLARAAGQSARGGEWASLAARVRDSFLRVFWSDRHGHLADAVDATGADHVLRPNQLYAIALPHVLLPRDKAQRVLEVARRSLLTPVGLRTLAPSDPAYAPHGARPPRAAWAQGAAWPFFAPLFFDALIRIQGEAAKAEAWRWLDGLAPRLEEAGLGSIPEAFEGEPPHRPLGAIASACNVGEVLRLAVRLGRRPLFRPPRPA